MERTNKSNNNNKNHNKMNPIRYYSTSMQFVYFNCVYVIYQYRTRCYELVFPPRPPSSHYLRHDVEVFIQGGDVKCTSRVCVCVCVYFAQAIIMTIIIIINSHLIVVIGSLVESLTRNLFTGSPHVCSMC